MKSMTGFGRANYDKDGRSYVVDIKTVNNKYSDISVKMPRRISSVEEKVRKQISTKIARGKVDVYITLENYTFIIAKFLSLCSLIHNHKIIWIILPTN